MYKWIFKFIQRWECVKKYEGGRLWSAPGTWDARSHIKWGCWLAWMTIPLTLVHPLFVHAYLIAFICHSPGCELVWQYHKEMDKPLHNVMAQMIERGFSFVLFLPLWIATYVLVKFYGFYLLKIWGL